MVKIGISLKLFFFPLKELDVFMEWRRKFFQTLVVPRATFHINCHGILPYTLLLLPHQHEKGGNWDLPSSVFPVFRHYSEKRCTLLFLLDTHVLMRSRKMGRKARLVSINTLLILLPFFALPSLSLVPSLSVLNHRERRRRLVREAVSLVFWDLLH